MSHDDREQHGTTEQGQADQGRPDAGTAGTAGRAAQAHAQESGAQAGLVQGVPSAQVPDVLVEANDGQRPAQATGGDPYVDGNLDGRGDVRSGPLQHDPLAPEVSLDAELDSSGRTDGQGSAPADG